MKPTSTTDEKDLLLRLRDGDEVAFAEIYDRYKGILYVHAYRLLEDYDASEDVVHDVFLALWQNREDLKVSSTLHAYLYVSIRNRIFKVFARRQVADRYLALLAQFQPDGSPADEQLLFNELTQLIEQGSSMGTTAARSNLPLMPWRMPGNMNTAWARGQGRNYPSCGGRAEMHAILRHRAYRAHARSHLLRACTRP